MNTPIVAALPKVTIPETPKEDRIAASVAKPNAFAKPAAIKAQAERSTRFRPLLVKNKGPRRARMRKRDPRVVKFY